MSDESVTRFAWKPFTIGSAVVVVLFVLLFHVALIVHECSFDNNGCANYGPSDRYVGRVFTASGAPAGPTHVEFYFASVDTGRAVATSVPTDAEGRFCLVWGDEAETPFVSAAPQGSSGPPDPRVALIAKLARGPVVVSPYGGDSEGDGGILLWRTASGGVVTRFTWRAAADSSQRCEHAAPPWYRVENLGENWRSLSIFGLVFLTLLLSPLRRAARRSRAERWLASITTVTAIASIALLVFAWAPALV